MAPECKTVVGQNLIDNGVYDLYTKSQSYEHETALPVYRFYLSLDPILRRFAVIPNNLD
jgi:hypothetical protein